MVKKLGVIVPYRDRYEQLGVFTNSIKSELDKQNIPYEIIIVEQDDAKQFNRGMLLNIGFKYAKKLGCKYVVLHDVDMLPIKVDYSYSDVPVHMATDFQPKRDKIFDEYFGGVTMFPVRDFQLIDGYSNKYWDWGYEDTDLLYRCKKHQIDLNQINVKNVGNSPTKALKFNGINSYVVGKNIFDTEFDDLTFFISFYPDDILCDHTKDIDYYTTFSIPGYDTSISFTSFSRYNFISFKDNDECVYLNSRIKPNYKTNIIVTLDNKNKKVTLYQDGEKIDTTSFDGFLKSYGYERYFYLGCGKPDRVGDERFFKGHITSFASFSGVLNEEEIVELSKNDGPTKTSENLKLHYDANHIENYQLMDLSGNKNNGKIYNCEIVDLEFSENKIVQIPHRRQSLFGLLKHEENGFVDNKWKKKATRWNQLKFHNEVYLNDEEIKNDGLSTLQFVEHGKVYENNILHVNVGI